MAYYLGSKELEEQISNKRCDIDKARENGVTGKALGVLQKELRTLMLKRPKHHVPQHGAWWVG